MDSDTITVSVKEYNEMLKELTFYRSKLNDVSSVIENREYCIEQMNRITDSLTELYKSGDYDNVVLMLESGVNVNQVNSKGLTPLMIATMNKQYEIASILISYGAIMENIDNDGCNAFYYGVQYGMDNIEDIFYTYKSRIADNCYININQRNKEGNTPLHIASQNGNIDAVSILSYREAHINILNSKGYSPLLIASANGHTEIVEMLLDRYNENNKKYSIDINYDEGCCTSEYHCRVTSPIHIATENGHIDVVKLLIKNGAKVNNTINIRNTTLKTYYENGTFSMYGYSTIGITPLYIASKQGYTDIVKLLIDNGANVNYTTITSSTTPFYGKDIYNNDKNRITTGMSPLHIASQYGHVDVVTVLINNGANVGYSNELGYTALDIAIQNGHTEVVTVLMCHYSTP